MHPACHVYTKADDGLVQPWQGCVFMNPPFGGRHGHLPWLQKFLEHGDGVAIVRAYTSAGWFHDLALRAESMLFPRGKTKFLRPDGSVGRDPGHGVVLLGMGERSNRALADQPARLLRARRGGRKLVPILELMVTPPWQI